MPDHAALVRLLELQREDSAIAGLRHRLENLPEAERLRNLNARREELASDVEIATKQRDEVARAQDRLEGEISLGDQKLQREERRLFSGQVANPKELAALQAEVEMLKRKRGALEDELLEAMVQRDQTTATLESLSEELTGVQREVAEVDRLVEELVTALETELHEHEQKRNVLAKSLDTGLVDLYEKIRATKNGVGAAALEGDTCQGCHTKLPAAEVERLKAGSGLQRCDNCRRILVVP